MLSQEATSNSPTQPHPVLQGQPFHGIQEATAHGQVVQREDRGQCDIARSTSSTAAIRAVVPR